MNNRSVIIFAYCGVLQLNRARGDVGLRNYVVR